MLRARVGELVAILKADKLSLGAAREQFHRGAPAIFSEAYAWDFDVTEGKSGTPSEVDRLHVASPEIASQTPAVNLTAGTAKNISFSA